MPLSLAQVLALPELGMALRTPEAAVDREVRWVAVSEHLDPTPWLAGGDLLLTTGMALVDDPEVTAPYVDRLVAAEVAALGFGVGLTHQVIPESLVAAADAAGLAVLEVPQPVPFVAVSKAVSHLLSAEEYADSAASFDTQRRLIRAALTDAPGRTDEVVAVLARHTRGFCLHLDAHGDVLACSPPSSAKRAPALRSEIDRLRPAGLLASSAVSDAHEHIVIVPIGVKGVADGFLAVSSSRAPTSADKAVVNVAVSLLSWEISRSTAVDEGMDPWRRLLVAAALRDGFDPDQLDELGLAALRPRQAIAVWCRARHVIADTTLATLAAMPGVLACRRGSDVLAFCGVDDKGELPAEVSDLVERPDVAALGMSCVLDLTDAANVHQAIEQAQRASSLGNGLQSFAQAPTRGVAALIDAASMAAWSEGYLRDLAAIPEGPELMDTLQAWLDQHGLVDATAQQLGIHRHTVRHRVRRAEAVLGRSLDDPAVRADLWFALGARPHTA